MVDIKSMAEGYRRTLQHSGSLGNRERDTRRSSSSLRGGRRHCGGLRGRCRRDDGCGGLHLADVGDETEAELHGWPQRADDLLHLRKG